MSKRLSAIAVLLISGMIAGCGGGVAASQVNAVCVYHGGLAKVTNGPNNKAFVQCHDGFAKEIESKE